MHTALEDVPQEQRTLKLPLRVRSITEQARFPATPLPIVRHNSDYQIAPAAVAVQEQVTDMAILL